MFGCNLPGLPGSQALTSMFGCSLPVVTVGEQQCGDGGRWTTAQYGDNTTEYNCTEQTPSPTADDVSMFGINLKQHSGLHQHHMSSWIEKR